MSEGAKVFPDTTIKPFRIRRRCHFPLTVEQIAADRDGETQNHVDALGCQLFQARDDILDTFERLAVDAEYRGKLGASGAAKFDALSRLEPNARAAALAVAEDAMNRLIDATAQTLGVGETSYSDEFHYIEYRIESRLFKIVDAISDRVKVKALARCVITDEKSVLANSFGRWLNMFGARGNTKHG
jgi:hypothetical protein